LTIGNVVAQTRGEAGKFFIHAVFVCRLVFRDSQNKILADSDIAARKDLRIDFVRMSHAQSEPMQKVRRSLWIVLLVLALILFLYPINSLPLRLALLGLTIGAYCSLIWFFRNRKPVSYGLIALAFLIGAFLVCPGKNGDPQSLQKAYLLSLRSYEDTRFFWGGENKFGVDCSGLVRAGLIKANFEQGLLTLNPGLVRFSLSLWWHDCSAQALGEEYRRQTKRIATAKSINFLEPGKIQPGDLAVTATGVHVLAFLGGNEWIEADPGMGKVVIVKVPADHNPWFQEPVHVMRWTELETK
jgi:hypothetical protein